MQHELLAAMNNPTLVYLVLLFGLYGLLFELVYPGLIVPGVLGGVAFVVALYALHVFPVNYMGLALIGLGVALIAVESFVPSFGILGIGGTVVFVLGSIFLIDAPDARYRISLAAIAAMAVFNVLVFIIGLNLAWRSRKKPVQHGMGMLVGALGETLGSVDLDGQALIQGEIWHVRSTRPIAAGVSVRVVAVSGLCLDVEEVIKEGE